MRKLTSLVVALLATACWAPMAFGDVSLSDPKGDDKGPGKYTYPTDAVYAKGSFDMTGFEMKEKGDEVEFSVTVNAKIEDPWNSKAWSGNGFSVQMAFIHIDTDHKVGSGHVEGLAGTNVKFVPESAWEKCIIISPQGPTRLNSEIDLKAAAFKKDIIVPVKTWARGKTLFALVKKSDLGVPAKGWGYQVLLQSNEGFPAKTDLLTRKVNEFEGQHRFGGGTDYDCDPHVMDILAGAGKGGADEAEAQYKALSGYNCGPDPSNAAGYKLSEVPMIYP
jgi:carbohydrate-binding DOMON domain-containing protein